jgi:cell division protein FtsQ
MWQDAKLLNSTANFLFGLVFVGALASGVWWLIHRPLFLLDTIRVEGDEKLGLHHVNGLSIRDQALPKIRGNFFTANVDEVRLAFESVPWVRRARVQREWPNKLRVALEEHRVLGIWGDNGKLISLNGDVFTANLAEAEEDAELVYLNGPDGSEKEVLAQYWQLKEWLMHGALS